MFAVAVVLVVLVDGVEGGDEDDGDGDGGGLRVLCIRLSPVLLLLLLLLLLLFSGMPACGCGGGVSIVAAVVRSGVITIPLNTSATSPGCF